MNILVQIGCPPSSLIDASFDSTGFSSFHESMTIYFMQALGGVQATNIFSFLKYGSKVVEKA